MQLSPGIRGCQDSANLGAEHLGLIQTHPDAAHTEEGILLSGDGQVCQGFVATDIEGADHQGLPRFQGFCAVGVDLGLLLLGGGGGAPHEHELATQQTDALRTLVHGCDGIVDTADVGHHGDSVTVGGDGGFVLGGLLDGLAFGHSGLLLPKLGHFLVGDPHA